MPFRISNHSMLEDTNVTNFKENAQFENQHFTEEHIKRLRTMMSLSDTQNWVYATELTRDNWIQIFMYLCWPDLVYLPFETQLLEKNFEKYYNESLKLRYDPRYDITNCSLMDFSFASRHFHPRAGFSRWVAFQQKRHSVVYDLKTSHHRINKNTISKVYYSCSSLLETIFDHYERNQHQWIGCIGLLIIALFIYISINIILYKNPHAELHKIFNPKESLQSLFKVTTTNTTEKFLFFDGLRVISMIWIILGHSVLYWGAFLPFENATREYRKISKNPFNYIFFAAVFAVDNFFYIGGFLTGYHFYIFFLKEHLKELLAEQTQRSKKNDLYRVIPYRLKRITRLAYQIIIFTWQRYVRIMGLQLILLFGYLAFNNKHMSSPTGSRYFQATNIACVDHIVPILTLTNNLFDNAFINECFGWTWYLANDFQFFILGLLLTSIAAFTSKKSFSYILFGVLLASTYFSIKIASKYHISITIPSVEESWNYVGNFLKDTEYFPLHPIMDYFYVKPWARVGPYLIGLLLGVFLADCKYQTEKQKNEETFSKVPNSESLLKKNSIANENNIISGFQKFILTSLRCRHHCFPNNLNNLLDSSSPKDSPNSKNLCKFSIATMPKTDLGYKKNGLLSVHTEWVSSDSQDTNSLLCSKEENLNKESIYSVSNVHKKKWLKHTIHKPLSMSVKDDSNLFETKSSFTQNLYSGNNISRSTSVPNLNYFYNKNSYFLKKKNMPSKGLTNPIESKKNVVLPRRIALSKTYIKSKCFSTSKDKINKIYNNTTTPTNQYVFDINLLSEPYKHILKNYQVSLFLVSIVLPLTLVLYGHLINFYPEKFQTSYMDSVYMGVQRTFWGISLGCLTLLIIFEIQNPSNVYSKTVRYIIKRSKLFLSHNIFLSIARLSFSIYLSHPIVLFAIYGRGYGPTDFNRKRLLICLVYTCLYSFVASVFLYILAENPLRTLSKMLMMASKNQHFVTKKKNE